MLHVTPLTGEAVAVYTTIMLGRRKTTATAPSGHTVAGKANNHRQVRNQLYREWRLMVRRERRWRRGLVILAVTIPGALAGITLYLALR